MFTVSLSRLAAVTMAVLLIGGGVRTVLNRAANERNGAIDLSDRLFTAPAAAVPYELEKLRPIRQYAVGHLREHLNNSKLDAVQRLHAAYALADVDRGAQEFVLQAVPTAPAAECRNLIAALDLAKEMAVPAIAQKARQSADTSTKVRYAILALHLGDPQPARALLAVKGDPHERTTFIRDYAAWHGDLPVIAELLSASDDGAFRSGLCAALGTLDPSECGMAAEALLAIYAKAPDGGTHAAAGWALGQWGRPLPKIEPNSGPLAGHHWFVNGQGITMIEAAPGTFTMGTLGEPHFDDEGPAHKVALTRPFYLADREVTVEQFQRFVDDADYPDCEKPQDWEGPSKEYSPTQECPVQMVSWFDAILYCNWLSARENRQACYERTGQKQKIKDYFGKDEEYDVWRCNFAAKGYRLPTEAEWEFAARAGSSADYCFGVGTAALADYAWFVNNADTRTWPGGRKLPNAWGLFDMHGNVSEWCWDYDANYAVETRQDPTGPAVGSGRVLRGGAVTLGALACRSAFRDAHRPTFRSAGYGFRLCSGR